jgi:hypothetical protein
MGDNNPEDQKEIPARRSFLWGATIPLESAGRDGAIQALCQLSYSPVVKKNRSLKRNLAAFLS